MHKHATLLKKNAPSRRPRLLLSLLLAGIALVLLSIAFMLLLLPQTAQTRAAIPVKSTHLQQVRVTATLVPTQVQRKSRDQKVQVKPTSPPVLSLPATPTPTPTQPTLIPSTPQQTQYGVFPLSSGGPIPVPEGVLHPTNIARVMLKATLVSVYAGSMTHDPRIGILCVLREDMTTGQMQIKMYQATQEKGPLTILTVRQNLLTIKDSTNARGTFDLSTNQFRW